MGLGPIPAPGASMGAVVSAIAPTIVGILGDISEITGELAPAIAPSLGANYSGDYMVVGAGTFAGVTCPTFSGDGFDCRALLRPVSCSVGSTWAEWLTCVATNPSYDRWESAIQWEGGIPYHFFEWIETGGTSEVDQLLSLGMIPNVWQEIRHTLEFDVDGVGVKTAWRRVYNSFQADDTTDDTKWWAIVSRQLMEAPTSLIANNDTLPWSIGTNANHVTHVAWIEAYDGIDGTQVLGCDAEDASDPTTIPDSIQTGQDWEATGSATVTS